MPIVATPTFQVTAEAAGPSAAVQVSWPSGFPTGSDLRAGEGTFTITLSGATWPAAGTDFDNQRQPILDGIESDSSEENGWNAHNIPGLIPPSSVVRTSDTVVTITLPPLPDYQTQQNESLQFTLPASAVVGASLPVEATPLVVIQSLQVVMTGTAVPSISASQINSGGATITITVSGENMRWNPSPNPGLIRTSLNSGSGETNGWNAQRANIPDAAIVKQSDTQYVITLPALPDYLITQDEDVVLTLDGSIFDPAGPFILSDTHGGSFTITQT